MNLSRLYPLEKMMEANEQVASFYGRAFSNGLVEATIQAMKQLIGGEMHLAFLTHSTGLVSHATSHGKTGSKLLMDTMSAASSHPLIYQTHGKVMAISDVITSREWQSREMYQAAQPIIRMEDSLGVDLQLTPEITLSTCIIRERRGFSEVDRLLFQQMLPHFHAIGEFAGILEPKGSPFLILETGEMPRTRKGMMRLLEEIIPAAGPSLRYCAEWISAAQSRPLVMRRFAAGSGATHCHALYIPKEPLAKSTFIFSFPWLKNASSPVACSPSLTQRENEVGHWLCQGKTNREIAMILNIQTGTVKRHLENIYEKLNVPSRTCAARVIRESRHH